MDYNQDYEDYVTPLIELEEPFDVYSYENDRVFGAIQMFIQIYLISTIKMILCVFVAGNDIFLIYAICKFKRLQTKTNYIILNFIISNLVFSTLSALLTVLEGVLYPHIRYYLGNVYPVCIALLFFYLVSSILLALILSLDWLILAYFTNMLPKYQKIYKGLIALAYFISFIVSLGFLISGLLYGTILQIRHGAIFTIVTYLLCILTTVVINIIKHRKTPTQESLRAIYSLRFSNIFFLMWSPMLIDIICLFIVDSYLTYRTLGTLIVIIITHIVELLAFASPLLLTIMLKKNDKNFKMSFDSIIKRSVHQYLQADDTENTNDDLVV